MNLTLSRAVIAIAVLTVPTAGRGASASAPSPDAITYDQPAMQARMREKLANMHKVQEGMLLGDWALLQDGLKKLMELAGTSTWYLQRTDGYHRASTRFYQAAEDLQAAAEKHDMAAATLPYVRLDMACIECHQEVRAKIGH